MRTSPQVSRVLQANQHVQFAQCNTEVLTELLRNGRRPLRCGPGRGQLWYGARPALAIAGQFCPRFKGRAGQVPGRDIHQSGNIGRGAASGALRQQRASQRVQGMASAQSRRFLGPPAHAHMRHAVFQTRLQRGCNFRLDAEQWFQDRLHALRRHTARRSSAACPRMPASSLQVLGQSIDLRGSFERRIGSGPEIAQASCLGNHLTLQRSGGRVESFDGAP